MVSVCLPSDALLQHLPSYLGFSYLGRGVSLLGCSSKAQPLLLILDEGYLLTAAPDHTPEVRGGGQEELPRAKELRLCGHRRAKGSYSMFKVRRGSREEIPLIQDKEQWLHFVGAAMKRNPTSKVRETQVRW